MWVEPKHSCHVKSSQINNVLSISFLSIDRQIASQEYLVLYKSTLSTIPTIPITTAVNPHPLPLLFLYISNLLYLLYSLQRAQIINLKDQQRKVMPHKQAHQPQHPLQHHQLHRQPILPPRPPPHQPQIQQREIRALDNNTLLIRRDSQQPQAMQQMQKERHDPLRRRGIPRGDGGFEQAGARVESGETVARTGDQAEELRGGVDEVEDLRDEEEEERFGEVAEDADDGEDHAGEVAVGVSDEDARGVPVVPPEGERDAEEGEEHVEGEEVRVGGWVRVGDEEVECVV